MRFIFFGLLFLALGLALDLWLAQLAVWGLSMFHVDSGIFGPLLLIFSAEGVIGSAVAIGGNN